MGQHHALRAVKEHISKGTMQHGSSTSRFRLTESGHDYWKSYQKQKTKRKSVPIRMSNAAVVKNKRKSVPKKRKSVPVSTRISSKKDVRAPTKKKRRRTAVSIRPVVKK